MPCLNEEATIGNCVQEALLACEVLGINAEVIVVDNNSRDRSSAVAQKAGVRVLNENRPGYGRALGKGLQAANHDYIITGDSDGQHIYSPDNIEHILEQLRSGADFVNGTRFRNGKPSYPMPFVKRLGNLFL